MAASRKIHLAVSDPLLAALLAEQIAVLPGHEPSADADGADLVVTDHDHASGNALVIGKAGQMQLPLRLGALMDQIRYQLSSRSRHTSQAQDPRPLGAFRLLAASSTLEHIASGETIRLTDKERLFLQALLDAPGHALGRQTLLDLVWGYAAGVETHTLETHLYRLRQKLEACGEHALIVSADGVYKLNI